MSGPMFMHMETYAMSVSKLRKAREATRAAEGKMVDRKLTVEEICGEAARSPGHCPHVADAKAPVLLFGISPDALPAMLQERISAANAAIKARKAAMPRGARASGPRAIRADSHTLITMVTSYPTPWCDPQTSASNFDNPDEQALLDLWVQRNLAWAKLKAEALGFELASVVLHTDETYPHLHFLGLPAQERIQARACHPGYRARDALEQELGEDDKAFKRRRDGVYKDAMRTFQDDYFSSVALDAGLLRTGPKRKRLTRGAYLAQKNDARARGLASSHLEKVQQSALRVQKELEEANLVVTIAEGDAANAIFRASEAETKLSFVERELSSKQADVSAFNMIGNELEIIVRERERENDALEKARKNREAEEAASRNAKEQAAKELAELRRQQCELNSEKEKISREKREFNEQRARNEREFAAARADIDSKQRELDAILDGVDAFADGRLRFQPDNKDLRFILAAGPDGIDRPLGERLKVVKPRLVPIFKRLDEAMAQRAMTLSEALAAAVSGWSRGVLRGLGEPRDDGRPTFEIPDTPEGDLLVKQIDPHRELVASVISVLPDWRIIRAVKRGLVRLSSRLSAIDRAEVTRLEEAMSALQKSKSAER